MSTVNPHPVKLPGPAYLHELVYQTADSSRLAIEFLDLVGTRTTLTYSELNERSNSWALELLTLLGNVDQPTVAVLLPTSVELYIVYLAILKAGAAFCPIDVGAPTKRARFIVKDTAASLVISNRKLRDVFLPETTRVVSVEDLRKISSRPNKGERRNPSLEDPAYILYTSGSSGLPKGVAVSHSAACQSLLAHDAHLPQFDRFLQFSAPTFDVSVFEIFFTLFRGSTIVSADRKLLISSLPSVIEQLHCDAAELTPTVADGLLGSRQHVPRLRLLLTIGEMLTRSVIDEFGGNASRPSILWAMYGPTECAIHCTLQAAFSTSEKVECIGRPLDTVSCFVAAPTNETNSDNDFVLLPRATVGELVLGGHQLALGYLNREEENKKAFINSDEYGRLYRTGDQARMRPDGTIEILGRISLGQVKLRGQRIELGEIEQIINRNPSVRSSVALVIGGNIIAFCLASDLDNAKRDGSVLEGCRSSLPPYMIPSDVVFVSEFPRLSSGKIDRKQLESFYTASRNDLPASGAATEDQDPESWSEFETIVREEISRLLNVPVLDIQRTTSFFRIGLDSLSAIALAHSISRRTGMPTGVSTILKYPSIFSLFREAPSATNDTHSSENPDYSIDDTLRSAVRAKLLGRQIDAILPTTPLQEAMLSHSEFAKTSYQNRLLYKLHADWDRFKAAWSRLVERHAILRTVFVPVEHPRLAFVQVVLSDYRPEMPTIEATQYTQQHAVMSHGATRLAKCLADCQPPWFIAQITSLGTKHLLFSLHHAIYDGTAMSLLASELEIAYNGGDLPVAVPFKPFLNAVMKADSSEALEFWSSRLANSRPAEFPHLVRKAEAKHLDNDRSIFSADLSVPISHLDRACQSIGISMLVLLQTAWAKCLAGIHGSDDFCFGNVVSGRTVPVSGIERLIAPTFNTLPVRISLGKADTNDDVMHRLLVSNAEALEFQLLSLRKIQSITNSTRRLFDTLLILQQPALDLDHTIWELIEDDGVIDFPIVLEAIPNASCDTLKISLHHQHDTLQAASVSHLFRLFNAALDSCIIRPEAPISHLEIGRDNLNSMSYNAGGPSGQPELLGDALRRRLRLNSEEFEDLTGRSHIKDFEDLTSWCALCILDPHSLVQLPFLNLGELAVVFTPENKTSIPAQIRSSPDIIERDGLLYLKLNVPARMLAKEDILLENSTSLRPKTMQNDDVNAKAEDDLENGRTTQNQSQCSDHDESLWTPTDRVVRQILTKYSTLHFSKIRRNMTIFQLGLDSISAVRVASNLKHHGFEVSAFDIMEQASIKDIAQFLDQHLPSTDLGKQVDFDSFERRIMQQLPPKLSTFRDSIESIRPCTPVQSGIISRFLRSRGSEYYNSVTYGVEAKISINALHTSWLAAFRDHVMLRTGFIETNDFTHSFAMVTYRPYALEPSLVHWQQPSNDLTGLRTWSKRMAEKAHDELHLPSFHVVLSTETGMTISLAALHALFDARSLHLILRDVLLRATSQSYHRSTPPTDRTLGLILSRSLKTGEASKFWATQRKHSAKTKFPSLTPLRVTGRRYGQAALTLSTDRSKLERACRAGAFSLQAAAQAAWSRILSAYTGDSNVTFGVVMSGVLNDDMADTAFPTAVTIPLSVTAVAGNRVLLDRMMDFGSSIHRHQHLPLIQIQHLMGHPDGNLFDTIFVYQKTISDDLALPFHVIHDLSTAEYPISIELEDVSTDSLSLNITFREDILPHEQAVLILKQLELSLVHLITHPNSEVSDIEASRALHSVTPAKIHQLPSPVKLLHEFVEQSASVKPMRYALEFVSQLQPRLVSEKWTYQQLDEEGNRIANLLSRRDVCPGQLVAICFEKCAEASFAILGILKAGCAMVAIDPSAPKARRQYIIDDSAASLLITMKQYAIDFEGDSSVDVLYLDEIDLSYLPTAKPQLSRVVDEQDLCYCLYTSGTTGTPKGCEITHENATQAMLSFQHLFAGHWDDASKWLQFASFHFDVSILEQYWSWSVGICMVSVPRDLLFEDLAAAIRTLEITHLDLTPSLARLLHPDEVPSLCRGVFITGGEQLRQDILDSWGDKGVIYNGYGPTEVTIGCTMYPRVPASGKPSNIGPQFLNVGTYVLEPSTEQPVLRGAVGELCLSGKLVGRGYLKRPELTQKKFPYIGDSKERVYRTGDLVRILHNGSFEFIGRIDNQVKLRGQRLETDEIDSLIKAIDEINDCKTLVVSHPRLGTEQLVTFIVLESLPVNASKSQIVVGTYGLRAIMRVRQTCCDRLPRYMIPSHCIPLSAMPLSANNKTDNAQLRVIFDDLPVSTLQYLSQDAEEEEERSGMMENEERLINIVADFLQIDSGPISRLSNLMELGVDSINAVALASQLRHAGWPNARTSIVLEHANLKSLASALDRDASARSSDSPLHLKQKLSAFKIKHRGVVHRSLGLEPNQVEDLAPCSPLQQGMISSATRAAKAVYFNQFSFELKDHVDLKRLKLAWTNVWENVAILRTVFIETDTGPVQVLRKASDLPWIEEHAVPHEKLSEMLKTWQGTWWRENKPQITQPFRIIVSEIRHESKTILTLQMFHALYDAISLRYILRKVHEHYTGQSDITYGPKFIDVLSQGHFSMTNDSRKFWTDRLGAVEPSKLLPSGNLNILSDGQASQTFTVGSEFEAARRSLRTTTQAFVQAAFLLALQEHVSGSATFGIVVSGRSSGHQDAQDTIGPMFNTIPFNVVFGANETNSSIIGKCHEYNNSVLPHQNTPLRDILKCVGRAGEQLFDAVLVFHRTEPDPTEDNRLWDPLDGDSDAVFPLALDVELSDDGVITAQLAYKGGCLDQEKASEFLQKFEDVLRRIIASPESLVTEVVDPAHFVIAPRQKASEEEHTPDEEDNFSWTPASLRIRAEIAKMAQKGPNEIKAHTSIFQLGLDSIDAIKLASALRKADIVVAVSQIMSNPTTAALAERATEENTVDQKIPKISKVACLSKQLQQYFKSRHSDLANIERILPATSSQEAMVAEMLSSDYHRYFNHELFRIHGGVDMDHLERAFNTVIAQSPILRTSMTTIDDPDIETIFAQLVHRKQKITFRRIDGFQIQDYALTVEAIRQETSLDTSQSPRLRLTFAKDAKNSWFLISIPHFMYDGWSLTMFHQDVTRAYHEQYLARPDYETDLGNIIDAGEDKAEKFWRSYLFDIAKSPIPSARHRDSSNDSMTHRAELRSQLTLVEIQKFCRSEAITLETLGQTCWSLVLASITKRLDVVYGIVLSGRDTESAQDILFPMMNTVPLRAIIHGSKSNMLHHLKDMLAEVRAHQHYPLRKMMRFPHDDVRDGLFDTLFIYQRAFQSDADGLHPLYESVEGSSDVEYPVCAEFEIVNGNLLWRCACRDTCMSSDESLELLQKLDDTLGDIIRSPLEPALSFYDGQYHIARLPPFVVAEDFAEASNSEGSEETANAARNGFSPKELILREVLSRVSKVPEVEIDQKTNIFQIGLDSISAIKVCSLLRQRSVRLSVNQMLQAGTLQWIAQEIRDFDHNSMANGLSPTEALAQIERRLERVPLKRLLEKTNVRESQVQHVLPATSGQTYFISAWQRSEGVLFYPVFTYTIFGDVTEDQIIRAWRLVVSRNPILRTIFLATEDAALPFVQIILGTKSDDTSTPTGQIAPRCGQDTGQMTFPTPLWKLDIAGQDNGWLLTLTMHHSLYDAVTLPVLMGQLRHLLSGLSLESVDEAFPRYILETSSNAADQSKKSFWTEYLQGATSSVLPQPDSGFCLSFEVFKPAALPIAGMEATARKMGVTIQALFLAVFAKYYSGVVQNGTVVDEDDTPNSDEVVFGIYLANRSFDIPGLVTTASPTVNIVPLRVKFISRKSIVDIAGDISGNLRNIQASSHSSVGLSQIEQWANIKIYATVNFLRLPDDDLITGYVSGSERSLDEISIRSNAHTSETARILQPGLAPGMQMKPAEIPDHMADATVLDAYPHCISIEAAIRDGHLDVGAFGPVDMLEGGDGQELVGKIINGLQQVSLAHST